jgi:ubiquinone/menaquinone biosynthesis C-methylase UbiE
MNTTEVKAFFEQTELYLTYNYNLRIRAETVGQFIGGQHFAKVLDMPCGTGDISAPFIDQFGHITMMDFSENMVATARSRVPATMQHKATFVNADFYDHNFKDQQYDLVMNIGILAHIREPWTFLEKSMQLVKPGGLLIIQNTDSEHWFGRIIHFYLALRRMLGIDKYALNKVPESELLHRITRAGFVMEASFSYNQSFLGFSRLFSNESKYRLTRKYFGYPGKERGKGSDATFLFRKLIQ